MFYMKWSLIQFFFNFGENKNNLSKLSEAFSQVGVGLAVK